MSSQNASGIFSQNSSQNESGILSQNSSQNAFHLIASLVLHLEVAALEDGQRVLHGTDHLPDAVAEAAARPRLRPRGTREQDGEGEEGQEGERSVDSGHLCGLRKFGLWVCGEVRRRQCY